MREVRWTDDRELPPVIRTALTHCPCCGAWRHDCVCRGGYTYNSQTGEHRSYSCTPEDHGRETYGFPEDGLSDTAPNDSQTEADDTPIGPDSSESQSDRSVDQ